MYDAQACLHTLICFREIPRGLGRRASPAVLRAIWAAPYNVEVVVAGVVPCVDIGDVCGPIAVVPIDLHDVPPVLSEGHRDAACPRTQIQQSHFDMCCENRNGVNVGRVQNLPRQGEVQTI